MKVYLRGGVSQMVCPKDDGKGGHQGGSFNWWPGSEHADHHRAELTCPCGERLIHAAGDDPWKHPFREVEGTPHGA